jgi:hypothetical protein
MSPARSVNWPDSFLYDMQRLPREWRRCPPQWRDISGQGQDCLSQTFNKSSEVTCWVQSCLKSVKMAAIPFMCSHIACTTESPFYASLHDISELPLSGPFHSIPHDMPVIYLMLTNIQPSRNPAGAFHPSVTKLSTPSPFQVCPNLVPLKQCNCFYLVPSILQRVCLPLVPCQVQSWQANPATTYTGSLHFESLLLSHCNLWEILFISK